MGAWGVGLQDNDTALDAIGDGSKLKGIVSRKDGKALVKLLNGVKNTFGSNGVLGVSEFVLNCGAPHTFLIPCRSIIDEALDTEKSEETLGMWTTPDERRRALNLFKKRIQGKSVDPEELAKYTRKRPD